MTLQTIRQNIVKDLTNDLTFINEKIKTFDEPVRTFNDLPLDNNDDGDIRVVLDENSVYLWNSEKNKWTKSSGGSVYSKTLFFTISEDNQTVINTGIRFDETGEYQTNSEVINFYLNGVLQTDENCYSSKNVNNELVVTWLLGGDNSLFQGDIIGIEFYQTNSSLNDSNGSSNINTEQLSVENLNIKKTFLPEETSKIDIGSTTNKFKDIYVDSAHLSTNNLYVGDTKVDLENMASQEFVTTKISEIELTPGPKGDKGDNGLQGPEGPNTISTVTTTSGFTNGHFIYNNNGVVGARALTKNDVGLNNVSNTSDLNKPISTAVQSALDGKASTATVTGSKNGLMKSADKTKLDKIRDQVVLLQQPLINGVIAIPRAGTPSEKISISQWGLVRTIHFYALGNTEIGVPIMQLSDNDRPGEDLIFRDRDSTVIIRSDGEVHVNEIGSMGYVSSVTYVARLLPLG